MALLNAEHLVCAPPRGLVALSFSIRPGLTLVRGGEGRGKTSLLRAIAGELAPAGGRLQRAPGATVFQAHPLDARYDARSAQDWLTQQAQGLTASWQAALADRLVEDFALAEHLAKPMAALSSGSRRKLGLVAEAANQAGRAWLLADYALPAGLAQVRLAGLIDLGD